MARLAPPVALVLALLLGGCAALAERPTGLGSVEGVVTWITIDRSLTMARTVLVYDSTRSQYVERSVDVAPRAAQIPSPRAGVVVRAHPRYRGGLFQRFRWRAARPVAEAVTDSLGRYALRVPPGRYLITAKLPPSFPCQSSTPVLVPRGLHAQDRIGDASAVEVDVGSHVEQDLAMAASCPT